MLQAGLISKDQHQQAQQQAKQQAERGQKERQARQARKDHPQKEANGRQGVSSKGRPSAAPNLKGVGIKTGRPGTGAPRHQANKRQGALGLGQRLQACYTAGEIKAWRGKQRYYFPNQQRVAWLDVSPKTALLLERGHAGIVRNWTRNVVGGAYQPLRAEAVGQLQALDAKRILLLHHDSPQQQAETKASAAVAHPSTSSQQQAETKASAAVAHPSTSSQQQAETKASAAVAHPNISSQQQAETKASAAVAHPSTSPQQQAETKASAAVAHPSTSPQQQAETKASAAVAHPSTSSQQQAETKASAAVAHPSTSPQQQAETKASAAVAHPSTNTEPPQGATPQKQTSSAINPETTEAVKNAETQPKNTAENSPVKGVLPAARLPESVPAKNPLVGMDGEIV